LYNRGSGVSEADGRNGGLTPETAYDGIADVTTFYQTPIEFYGNSSAAGQKDAADTTVPLAGVLDPNGVIRKVAASGTWIHLPPVDGGIGPENGMRTRFPVFPMHVEGNTAWKEIKAFQAVELTGDTAMSSLIREEATGARFELTFANGHAHTLQIDGHSLVTALKYEGDQAEFTTSIDNGHDHMVTIRRVQDGMFEMISLDPEEPHRLLALTDSVTVFDDNAGPNGAPEPEPEGGSAGGVIPAGLTEFMDQMINTTETMKARIAELEERLADQGSTSDNCAEMSDVKDMLQTITSAVVAE